MRATGLLLLLLGLAAPALAADPGVLALLGPDAVSSHSLTVGPPGATRTLAYTATAGTERLFDGSGAESAAVFYTAYVANGAAGTRVSDRPVTFVFNGGPGAASAYLHLGLVGPEILRFASTQAGTPDAGRAHLADNPETWLDFTDLVLIDPIGTGWSRTARPEDAQKFWGVRQDAEVLAKVLALWIAHAGRQASEKFLAGESYGGLRVVKVADALQHDQGLAVSGLIMISPLLDGALTFGGDRLALGAALKLPSIAAAALARDHRLTPEALEAAETFALGPYLATLAGPPPAGAAADAFYGHVAALTGLGPDTVARSRGFLGREALHPGAAEVSAYDATFGVDAAFASHGDPVLDGFTRAFGGAFVGYARDTLGFRTDLTYQLLAGEVSRRWDWHSDGGALTPPRADDDLRDLLALDGGMKVMVASGLFDLVTPYASVRYTIGHLGLPPAAAARVAVSTYPAGHMIYLEDAARVALSGDAREFVRGTKG